MLLFIFKDFILLKKVYLFADVAGDSINYSFPHFVQISNYIRSEGLPKWSFYTAMGQNLYPLCITNPFAFIVYLADADSVANAIVFMELTKIILLGVIAFFYLRELKVTPFVNIIGALLFTFSGYVMLHGGWYDVFSTHAVYVLFLLFSFEKLLKGVWYWFPIAIALSASLSFFYLVLDCELLLIYSITRYAEGSEKGIKGWLFFTTRQGMLGALGLLISSVALVAGLQMLLESPRATGNMSQSAGILADPVFKLESVDKICLYLLRAFSTDILGTSIDSPLKVNPIHLESPVTYCGLITLLLIPQVFYFANKKRKIIYGTLFTGLIITIIFPFFRHLFWLFTGDYVRVFGFFIAIILLYLGIQAFTMVDKKAKISLPVLILTLLALLVALNHDYTSSEALTLKDNARVKTVMYFLFGLSLLLYLMTLQKWRSLAKVVLLATVVLELTSFTDTAINQRRTLTPEILKQRVGYNDITMEAVKYVNSIDKGFFRSARDYFSGFGDDGNLNSSQIQGYRGTSCYGSFNQPNYLGFLYAMRIDTTPVTAVKSVGLNDKYILQTWASVKYYFVKNPQSMQTLQPMGYDSISQVGDVKILRNRLALPLGIAYDRYITSDEFEKATFLQKNKILLHAFIIKNEEREKYSDFAPVHTDSFPAAGISLEEYINPVTNLRKDTLSITDHTQNSLNGKIDLKEKKLVFFSIPFDKGWKAFVNGKEQTIEKVNVGFMGLLLDKGQHAISLEFEPYLLKESLWLTLLGILVYGFCLWKFRNAVPIPELSQEKSPPQKVSVNFKKKKK